jgi:hypothetical protein
VGDVSTCSFELFGWGWLVGIIRLERVSEKEKLAANAKLKAELDALKLLKIEHDAHCEPLADLFSSGQMTAAKYNAMTAAQTKAYHQYNQSFGSYMDGSIDAGAEYHEALSEI